MMSNKQSSMRLDEIAYLNPRRQLKKGQIAKLIDMSSLPTNHRSISLDSIQIRPYSSGSRFKNGDSLLARITPCLENGKSALINCLMKDEVAAGSTEFIVIAPKSEVDADFVYYASCYPEFRQYAISRMEGTSGRQRVSHYSIADFEFPYIGGNERIAIGSMLRSLDDRIENSRTLATNLEAIAKGLFKSWFVDFDPVRAKVLGEKPAGLADEIAVLFPDRFNDSEIGELPVGWSIKPVGELAEIVGGSTPSTNNHEFWIENKHSWATPKDLAGLSSPLLLHTERKISDSGLSQIGSGLLPPGTVLLSSRAPIGYLAISTIPVAINQGFIAMIPKPEVSNLFLLFWAEVAHETILANANGSTFLEISKKNFRPIPVVVPDKELMSAFSKSVKPLFARIECAEREIHLLGKIRDHLLSQLISGKLRVEDAEIILEEAIA